jgi:hypothetical protein
VISLGTVGLFHLLPEEVGTSLLEYITDTTTDGLLKRNEEWVREDLEADISVNTAKPIG